MDQFLHEQHTYTLAQNAQAGADVTDEATSWVMLNREGRIEPLPNEKILHEVAGKVRCDLSSREFTNNSSSWAITSDSGKAYVTSQRVIFLAGKPSEEFRSFSARVLDIQDSRIESTFFAGWRWTGVAKPVTGGGIPADVPLVRIHLTFKEGGHYEFFQTFTAIKQRLHQAREMGVDTRTERIDIEPPPVYTARGESAASASAAGPSAETRATGAAGTSQDQDALRQPPPPPNEPPPDYEEAQAEAVRVGVEERLRGDAERASS